jgi:uncharacterized protein (DUF983 family)
MALTSFRRSGFFDPQGGTLFREFLRMLKRCESCYGGWDYMILAPTGFPIFREGRYVTVCMRNDVTV